MPTVRLEVVKVAVGAPPEEDSVPVPSVVEPCMKFTVPLGVPEPGDVTLTVAVNVTGWPAVPGFDEEVTIVVVLALLTVWLKEPLLLGKLLFPL